MKKNDRYGKNLRRFSESDDGKKFRDRNQNCEICGKTSSQHKLLCIDHDHETGQIRGILCSSCNFALGHLEEFLEKSLAYLKKSKESTLFLSQFGPMTKDELREIAKKTLTRNDVVEKRNKTLRSEEKRNERSQRAKDSWNDPAIRLKRIDAMKRSWTQEAREKMGNAVSLSKRKNK